MLYWLLKQEIPRGKFYILVIERGKEIQNDNWCFSNLFLFKQFDRFKTCERALNFYIVYDLFSSLRGARRNRWIEPPAAIEHGQRHGPRQKGDRDQYFFWRRGNDQIPASGM